ncbi:MAG: AAA family ATPase, partial [Methanomicrobia archaeon]|nr:AAA family ATPase [Methanomicrobia archaeon]
MKIVAFTIKNYRSIKELKIENLNPANVFFGKNNVGKSNILRGLHLAFSCLKNDEIFLPDTMFYKRDIYKPI